MAFAFKMKKNVDIGNHVGLDVLLDVYFATIRLLKQAHQIPTRCIEPSFVEMNTNSAST